MALPSVISITVTKSARVNLPVVNVGVYSNTTICHSILVSEIIPEQDDMDASSNVDAAPEVS